MKRIIAAGLVIAVAAAGSVSSAQPGGPGGQGAAMQSMRQAQMQDMSARMMRLQTQLQQLNQRMMTMQVHQSFKDLGAGMGQMCTGLQQMERHMQQLREDPAFAQKQERVGSMQRLEDRARVMSREMEEAHEGLDRLVAMPARPGPPPDADEQLVRAQHQQEIEQDQKRADERLKALESWSKGDGILIPARDLTKDLLQLRDRVRLLSRDCDRLSEDPQIELDRDRLREIDRVRDRLRVILREIEESANTLQSGIAA
ncbi:MAG TPA: hypothetical protein VFS09_10620 [Candidatus Eisenbacteria bacterium]|nr:hypothetical protein [Candidatus Eisenbacteria bacterium]